MVRGFLATNAADDVFPLQNSFHPEPVVNPLLLLHIDLLAFPGLICCLSFESGLNAPPRRGCGA